jgi:hypothetical protein
MRRYDFGKVHARHAHIGHVAPADLIRQQLVELLGGKREGVETLVPVGKDFGFGRGRILLREGSDRNRHSTPSEAKSGFPFLNLPPIDSFVDTLFGHRIGRAEGKSM